MVVLQLIPIVFVWVVASSLSILVNKRIGIVFPAACNGIILVLYFCTLLTKSFTTAFAVTVLIALLFLAVACISKSKIIAKRVQELCLTPAGIAYWAFALICVAFAWKHGQDPLSWDEFAHWGQMTKEIIRLDYFYTDTSTTLLFHNDYPPAVPLWEAAWCRFSGGFDGRSVYVAIWLLQCLFLLPAMEELAKAISKPPVLSWLIIFACFVSCTFLFMPSFDGAQPAFWKSFYPDTLLGIIAGYVLYLSITSEESIYSAVTFGMCVCACALIKQSSLLFVIVAIGAVFVKAFFLKDTSGKRFNRKWMASFLFAVIGVVVGFVSWKIVIAFSQVPSAVGEFHVPLEDVLNALIGRGANSEWFGEMIRMFADACLTRNFVPYAPIAISYVMSLLLLAGLNVTSCLVFDSSRKRCLVICTFEATIWTLYLLFMLFAYTFSFNQFQAAALASFERYMGTCLVALFVICLSYFAECVSNAPAMVKSRSLIFLLTPIVLAVAFVPSIIPGIWNKDNAASDDLKRAAEFLASAVPEEAHVFVVNEGSRTIETLKLAYYSDGVTISRDIEPLVTCHHVDIEHLFSEESLSWEASEKDMAILLSDEDYLFLWHSDTYSSKYASLFNSVPESGVLYRIEQADNSLYSISEMARF